MSIQIDTAFVQQFKNNISFLVQQEGCRLEGTVMSEGITGEKAFWEQIGPTAMVKRTTRHSDTPLVNTEHDRRMCVFEDYEWADLIDKQDRLRLLIEPTSAYAQNASMAVGRTKDQVILTAALATAYAGKDGTTAVAFDSTNNAIAVTYNEDGSVTNTNMTVGKVRKAAEILDANEARNEDRIAVISAAALRGLRRDDEFTSYDYNDMKPLASGAKNVYWMGFRWILTELIPKSGATHTCLFWQKAGLKLGVGEDMRVHIDERPDKSYATQVYVAGSWGATRMQEKLVVSCACLATA